MKKIDYFKYQELWAKRIKKLGYNVIVSSNPDLIIDKNNKPVFCEIKYRKSGRTFLFYKNEIDLLKKYSSIVILSTNDKLFRIVTNEQFKEGKFLEFSNKINTKNKKGTRRIYQLLIRSLPNVENLDYNETIKYLEKVLKCF